MIKPIIILVAPQMGENIGATARAMKNFALSELRIVMPRDGWPNDKANALAAGATDILQAAKIYACLATAIADLTYVYATTASKRDMTIKYVEISDLNQQLPVTTISHKIGIMFGRESCGLRNEEIALANKIIYIATNPAFTSLNIAQAVLLICYELFHTKSFNNNLMSNESLVESTKQARDTGNNINKNKINYFFEHLFTKLDDKQFFRASKNNQPIKIAIQNIFNKIENLSVNELQILHGIVNSLSK